MLKIDVDPHEVFKIGGARVQVLRVKDSGQYRLLIDAPRHVEVDWNGRRKKQLDLKRDTVSQNDLTTSTQAITP